MNVPESFSRGARPACFTRARAVLNRRGSPLSARIAAAPTGGDTGDRGDQRGQFAVRPARRPSGPRCRPADPRSSTQSVSSSCHSFERTAAMIEHPRVVAQRGEQFADDPQRTARCPPRLAISRLHCLFEPGQSEPAGPVQVTAVAVADNAHRRGPAARLERMVRRVQRRRARHIRAAHESAGSG